MTSYETRGGHASRDNSLAAAPHHPAYFAWPHLVPWTWSTSAPEFIGLEASNGGELLHFRIESLITSTGGEPPAGTNRIIDTYIRADTLMPVRVSLESVYADREIEPTTEAMYFGNTEFVPRSALQSGFFAAFRPHDFLRTRDEQIQAGEATPVEVYWLGDPASVAGTLPAGDFTELRVEDVQQQGNTARVTYEAASVDSPGLLSVTSGTGLFEDVGITRRRDEAVAAGNTVEVEGGVVYWYPIEFTPCARQNDPAGPVCTATVYGALLELAGAQVHLEVHFIGIDEAPGDDNKNPFASVEALTLVTRQLVALRR